MLPGLQALLEAIPRNQRQGWVVNPLPLDNQARSRTDWFKPITGDLLSLAQRHSNTAIAKACGVSEAAVRKWLEKVGIERDPDEVRTGGEILTHEVAKLRARAENTSAQPTSSSERRLTTEYVGRMIGKIGEKAGIVVRQPDEETGKRIKYASAHDLRRGCAYRLINAGVSAETLKIVLRHEDFKTTERYYGAVREAQAAAAEVYQKLLSSSAGCKKNELIGEIAMSPQLNPEEFKKLKALLNSL